MARKTSIYIVEDEGRDKGKMFILNEMPASQAEKWAIRVFLAMARSGVDVPDDIASRGIAGIAIMGLKALGNMNFYDAEPLLDEMFSLISCVPDPAKQNIKRGYGGVGPMIEDDIEEPTTRLKLRKEILALHINFSTAADLLT